ncbi:hypothetical protein A2419_01685 [Candidatus Adlerbacteria bacterium RIFOXYC1_FULL_48_26]|uniref:POTRA domain-containing protein n=1 Tax=Candidatus Adlerbacteria bacterium RIFOXYC1_FULL_48_26 TaxID=1797247 RepID=A0A1F4Y3T4_9BACT|nr:MAG: hypothetical protein A2419_01685 [Candidatus Adlerbacteria bacterium RIFOXYC1_FULL_48_26]OGC93420.1 MAG: hypothetical protein A2389_02640 [Candidatus Adlerbacteria bacterium RIFOXYB1_FULL_48_10]
MLLGAICAVLVLLFLLSLWFANTSWLKITHVSVSGENVVPQASIEEVVQDGLVGKYAGLFSKANIFFYPKKSIEQDLHTLYPTLGTISIRALDFHTIAVTVSEREPSALWCPAADSTQCVLLDESGFAYAHAPEYSGNVYKTYLGALPDGPLPKQFLTPERFHSLSALVETFAKKIATTTVTTVAVDENNDVHIGTSDGYKILFALEENGGDVFQHFVLTLTAAPFTTHALSEFEYIDLRFGDKVYYKLKN